MAEAPNSSAPDTPLREPTYSEIVWGQFKKNGVAFAALFALLGLFVLAVAAPFIAMDVPFYARLRLESGETVTLFPLFHDLLFNFNVFGKGVDIFFNLLLVTLPITLPIYLVYRRLRLRGVPDRVRRARRRRFFSTYSLLFAIAFGALLIVQPAQTNTRWKEGIGVEMVDGEEKDVIFYQTDEGAARATLLTAVFPPVPYSYGATSYNINRPAGGENLLGTDESGRDMFTRMLYGTRLSLTIGVIAVSIYVFIGILLGAIAGYMGGRVDIVIQRGIEVVMVFPAFILILTFVSFLPSRSIFWIMVIIGLIRWTTVARLVRGEFLRLKSADFVQAAVAQGLQARRVIFRHVLPNALGPVLVAATFGVGDAILIEAVLSFLGVSDLDAPSWGRILYVGRSQHSLFTMLLPGIAIFITVSVLNLIGEGLRDALDPKLRK